ncbi:MAG: ribonuclease III [Firmicutes bacterium]|nr:ribonuclease III [Bacillota bacterium]
MNTDDFFNVMLDTEVNASSYSPLDLAYIGDAVFEVYVRTKLLMHGNVPVNKLHKEAKKYVSAPAQAKMFEMLKNIITEEEFAVMKRGRNAKSFTSAKNASIIDYRHATGVEALIGYLYLSGNNERIKYLLDKVTENQTENQKG